jgi:hypothetical protein
LLRTQFIYTKAAKRMKIGIIRRENPPDSRVTLTRRIAKALSKWNRRRKSLRSAMLYRQDYKVAGVPMSEDLSDRML